MFEVAALVVVVELMSTASAQAAGPPVAGGGFDGALAGGQPCRGCDGRVSLIVADDRASLLTPSAIHYSIQCPAGSPDASPTRFRAEAGVPQGTRITSGGGSPGPSA